jgi:ParB family transcriptional regulator, chromosome partitioning protein
MSEKRRGLGRGLGALLGSDAPIVSTPPAAPTSEPVAQASAPQRAGLLDIPVAAISPNPRQPRRVFEQTALDELRGSIVEFGVLVPIIVRALGDERYELIAGERRWRASAAAGLTTIPAIVREVDDQASLEVAIVENLQRENLDPLEEAMGFSHLMESFGFTQEDVARRLSRSRPAVTNALRLLQLSDTIKALVHQGVLSAGAARALLAIPQDRRDSVALRAAKEGLSVRAIEALAREPQPRPQPTSVASSPETNALVDRLRYRFATQIALTRKGRGGSIEIRFANDDELLRVADLLLGEGAE